MSREAYGEGYAHLNRKQVELVRGGNLWARTRIKNVLELAGLEGNKILDLGCGVGTFTVTYSKKGVDVVGVDFSKHALLLANYFVRTNGNSKKVEFVCADVQCLPLRDECFDKVVSADLVEHLYPNQFHRMMREVRRVLKRRGELNIYTPNPFHIFETLKKHNILKGSRDHVDLKTMPTIVDVLEENGFVVLKAYYKESYVPIFKWLEKFLMRISWISRFFRRRICVSGKREL